jgi:hypothetical protein
MKSTLGIFDRLKVAVTGKLPAEIKEPEDKSRAALVKELNEWWVDTRKFWKPVFDRIEEDIKFAAGQHWSKNYVSSEGVPYQADIVQRHIAQKESSLYAKNPTFTARRRERREFSVWDESQESLKGAQAILAKAAPMLQAVQEATMRAQHATEAVKGVQQSGIPLSPEHAAQAKSVLMQAQQHVAEAQAAVPPEVIGAQKIVADYKRGMMQKAYEEDVGDTLRLLFANQIDAQNPPFETQAKQLVTRVVTTAVGFVKIMLKRDMAGTPTETAVSADLQAKIDAIEAKKRMLSMPDAEPDSAAQSELELMEQQLAAEQAEDEGEQETTDEGVIIDFLPATSVIVDKNCRSLRGFVGCKRICHEILMEVSDAEQEFGISLKESGANLYYGRDTRESSNRDNQRTSLMDGAENELDAKAGKVCVGYIYDRPAGLCYVLIDGVKDFIAEPYAPKPDWEYFWPIIPLTFRPLEVEENKPDEMVTCYPRSDVRLIRPMQEELNRSGEAFKQHRIANRPGYVALGARWSKNDLEKLSAPRRAFEVLRIESVNPGEKVADFLQPIPNQAIDAKVYDGSKFQQDVLLVVGSQEADLGPTSDATATESRIAANSRQISSNSNVDDLEKFFTLMAKGISCLLFDEMSEETVKRLVGPGAVWPQLSMADMAENVWLEIEAGSSGPPNQELEISVAKQIIPLLIQIPGIDPELVAKFGIRALDPRIKTEDFFNPDSASIQAQQEAAAQGPKPPEEKVSLNYKDVPPSVQRQMEAAAGFKPATEMDGTVHMDAFKAKNPADTAPPAKK